MNTVSDAGLTADDIEYLRDMKPNVEYAFFDHERARRLQRAEMIAGLGDYQITSKAVEFLAALDQKAANSRPVIPAKYLSHPELQRELIAVATRMGERGAERDAVLRISEITAVLRDRFGIVEAPR